MIWLLAQLEEVNREAALKKGWWNLSFILLVGSIAVLFLIAMILLRRWKHKQIAEIEQDRAERRAGKTGERVDAWAASAQRYVDHDKLSPDEDLFERDDDRDTDDEDDGYPGDDDSSQSPEEDRDPFGLFSDKPFQETDDDDDYDDGDDDGDWDDEDEDEDEQR